MRSVGHGWRGCRRGCHSPVTEMGNHSESPAKFDDFDVRPRWFYPLVNVYITMENDGKSQFLMGKSTIDNQFQ